ncbi:MAG: hypothetical protein ABSC21_05260 [Terriglobia bacterium]
MKSRGALIITISCLLSATLWAQTKNALASDTSGWIDILPDESFKGWTRVAIPPDKALDPVSQWKLDKAHRIIIARAIAVTNGFATIANSPISYFTRNGASRSTKD